jgi:uncharacterized membrane protein YqaE (UPF0057 family)
MIDKLFSAIVTIGEVSVTLGEMLVAFINALVQLIQTAVLLFNPVGIVNDVITGSFMAIKIIVVNVISFFTKTGRTGYNKCKAAGEGLFGFRRNRNSEGKLIGTGPPKNGQCVRPKLFKILLTLVCPPLALFLHMGTSGWFHVIVCTIFTVYFFYFPGLIYTLLHILC